ncbi:hypothetical protein [Stenotrophomonas sp.]|uniref:hypothetical protein n=1 Tax=Stenotrophomonas sp. TaxID=69392 RepID=UPI0028A6AFAE|nr:hypothetical protein [Stenotrophomonas sp.]
MRNRRSFVPRSAVLLAFATLLLVGCWRTSRETVFSSDALKVVAVTESTLDINISEYRHYTRYALYVHGDTLTDSGFAALLRDPDAGSDPFVHTEAIVLDPRSILLASHNSDGRRCWTTRLIDTGATPILETINKGSIDCTTRQAPRGWRALYDESSNLLLIREQPFHVYPIAGYWYPLWIQGDVVALYQQQKERERLVVKLAKISSGEMLAEELLPMDRFAEPDLHQASAEARQQWLLDNFTVSAAPSASIRLRPDNRLKTISPEVWAEYKEIERHNREEDARVQAAGEAWHNAQREQLNRDEAERQPPATSP